jgi:hypothetical protein
MKVGLNMRKKNSSSVVQHDYRPLSVHDESTADSPNWSKCKKYKHTEQITMFTPFHRQTVNCLFDCSDETSSTIFPKSSSPVKITQFTTQNTPL